MRNRLRRKKIFKRNGGMNFQKTDIAEIGRANTFQCLFDQFNIDLNPDKIFIRILFCTIDQVFPVTKTDLNKKQRVAAEFFLPVDRIGAVKIRDEKWISMLFGCSAQ